MTKIYLIQVETDTGDESGLNWDIVKAFFKEEEAKQEVNKLNESRSEREIIEFRLKYIITTLDVY